jgi:hypothetical protein
LRPPERFCDQPLGLGLVSLALNALGSLPGSRPITIAAAVHLAAYRILGAG